MTSIAPLPPQVLLQYSAVLNSAMQQNHVPQVKALQITNNNATALEGLQVVLQNNLGIWASWQATVDSIAPVSSWQVQDLPLTLDWESLAGLTERQEGKITLTITSLTTNHILHQQDWPLTLLPFDHWQGVNVLPELLSAFVTPNLPAISGLLHQSAQLLGKWTGNPSLNDYQSQDPNRIRKKMAAIYQTIRDQDIIYATVPASFEQHGQRVRLADVVLTQKMGNCLDMSLLYAACLEAAGLHPIIVIIKGHAFVGCWLVQETFADATCYDASLLTKRMAEGIHDLALIEAVAMNAGDQSSFERAEQLASGYFANPDDFILFIDVKRARYGGVRPLPIRVKSEKGWQWIATAMPQATSGATASPTDVQIGPRLGFVDQIEIGRQQIWERKLLDLSLRNSLLNMRITRQTLQVLTPQLHELEDMLASGAELQLMPRPADWDATPRSAGLYETINASDPMAELVAHELKNKRLRCYLPEQEFNETFLGMYRKTKAAMEENGANTLFVALGVLRWYQTEQSQQPRFAPLILMPVEILRKGVQRGFVIRSREEESQINITLLEMLRQDFGITVSGLDPLPRDEQGVDVKQVLHTVRQLIMNQPRWDVEPQGFIGHFSFSKFVMWRDLHENAHLLARNEVVNSLLKNQLTWSPPEVQVPEASPDEVWKISDLLLPISADSSQLRAVGAALNGESFVLHGPPGTGKSQTITNIIANALYRGKRVLFVAEKMAALEVVEQRLDAIGLGTFCLELHSNKTRKSEILKQFKAVMEAGKPVPPAQYEQEATRIEALRTELNEYVTALHNPGPFGLSLFDCISAYNQFEVNLPAAPINGTMIEQQRGTTTGNMEDAARQVQAAAMACGLVANHPLALVQWDNYSRQAAQEVQEAIIKVQPELQQLAVMETAIVQSLGLQQWHPATRQQWQALQQWAALWLQAPSFPLPLWEATDPLATWQRVADMAQVGMQRDNARQEILQTFSPQALDVPATQALQAWQQAEQTWFLPKWLGKRKLTNALKQFANNSQFNKENVPEYYRQIAHYQLLAKQIEQESNWLAPLMGLQWQGGQPHWGELLAATQVLIRTYQGAGQLLADPAALKEWRQKMSSLWQEGVGTYTEMNRQRWVDFTNLWAAIDKKLHFIRGTLCVDEMAGNQQKPWLAQQTELLQQWLLHFEGLRDWCQYRLQSKSLTAFGLTESWKALENGWLPQHQFADCLLKGLYKMVADYQIDNLPALRTFNSAVYNEKINRYEALLQQFQELSKTQIAATVAARIPNLITEAAKGSEIGLLQKAIGNNGRGISIRQLLGQIPNLLPRLAPCMLMSPISVAQYLSLGLEPFDMVVFDEASQMPTFEAIGALARGNSVVVVGDPKQMPPTSFFASQQFDEENADKEDLESILDDCLALPMPSRYLLWHYRSRHESLIAFSNAKYYENKLLTFPSADDIQTKVSWQAIEGFYDRSRARHNKAEADALVNEVLNRLRQPETVGQSIGIVTFSSVQQKLIQDLMDAAFDKHPDLEALALQREEPMFIKNLENVQGDERDVILFSIGYGPDKEGKVYLNFGPINREGGWRRLNVAVSRARYEMKVFSTLRASHIDLSRTASEGVAGLRAFLEYAEKGKIALPIPEINLVNHLTHFETQLAVAIQAKGYQVHTGVGTSGFKIDIALVDPKNPGQYLLAILCDGRPFMQIAAARDRFVGKMQVLKQLGWPLLRVWATDWWLNREKVMLQIESAIQEALSAPATVALKAVEALPETLQETIPLEPEPLLMNASVITPRSTPLPNKLTYITAALPAVTKYSAAAFLLEKHAAFIGRQLNKVVVAEAPIHKKLLYQRVLQAWGITRAGNRIQGALDAIVEELPFDTKRIDDQEMVVFKGFDWDAYTTYRVPDDDNDETRRVAEMLPAMEVANAMLDILRQQFSMGETDLQREAARLLGFARSGTNVDAAMKAGFDYAVAQNKMTEKNGRFIIQ
jgi:hypothetical protein